MKAAYRKLNDGSMSSSKYHKLDGTPVRQILKRQAEAEVRGVENGTRKDDAGALKK